MEVDAATWRKAKRSEGGANNCVEIAIASGAVRDSKNPDGPVLAVDVLRLLAAARLGQLDH